MDRLWTPWRYDYITGHEAKDDQGRPERPGVPPGLRHWPGSDQHCVFCNMLSAVAWAKASPEASGMTAEQAEHAAGILLMSTSCFVCLNRFPYYTGHLLILPYIHTASLAALSAPSALEFVSLAQRAEGWLRSIYTPDGLNFGINMGAAAGAGVAGHLHLHALPRWVGDSSFITVVGETRILPELLENSWLKLRKAITDEQRT